MGERKLREPLQRGGRKQLAVAGHGGGGARRKRVGRQPAADGGVVVAHQGDVHHAVNGLQQFNRMRAIAHDVAQADDLLGLQVGEVGQYGLPGRQVGVQV